MKVKSEREVVQLCLTLHDPMDYSLPGSSVHGIFQARVLEWNAIALGLGEPFFSLREHREVEDQSTSMLSPFIWTTASLALVRAG